ncbi:hypothetical protein [Promicromonospora sp. NPDC057488]|uniref:hypothetical protein n=1 Tax=Promicromonospora sp. NPDC057488 TaxID=3346147 RepID=UPI00366FF86A
MRPTKRRLIANGLLPAALGVLLLVPGCSLDNSDECAAATAEHGAVLMSQAVSFAGEQGDPEVGCDDTAGPPAYAVFDLKQRPDEAVLADHGWLCAERNDDEELPGVVCSKSAEGVPLELTTAEFMNGPVEVWIYADPPRSE